MFAWLWGCMILAIKVAIGSLAWSILMWALAMLIALLVGGTAVSIFNPKKMASKWSEPKEPEDFKDWAEEQDVDEWEAKATIDLQKLADEIDEEDKD